MKGKTKERKKVGIGGVYRGKRVINGNCHIAKNAGHYNTPRTLR